MSFHAIPWSVYDGITVGFGHAWLHGGSAAVGQLRPIVSRSTGMLKQGRSNAHCNSGDARLPLHHVSHYGLSLASQRITSL